MAKFNVGDVVRLKSGGPAMTVSEVVVQNPIIVICMWFSGSEIKSAGFDENLVDTSEADGGLKIGRA